MKHSADFIGYAVIVFSLQFLGKTEGAGGASCKDFKGFTYESGSHYVPGADPCTLCICENGNPVACKGIFCRKEVIANKECTTFRVGNSCCELICVDDAITSSAKDKSHGNGHETHVHYDIGLRLIGSCATAVLSISLLIFLIHRLRRRKIRVCAAGRQTRQGPEDQRSLGSMGYLDRNDTQNNMQMDELPFTSGYPLWKPPYFPRGEAPPPYEEAVAAARAEQAALLSMNSNTMAPLNYSNNYLTPQHAQANVSIVVNSQNGLPASSPSLSTNNNVNSSAVISTNNRPMSSPAVHSNYYPVNQNELSPNYCLGSCTNYVIGSNTYENLPNPANRASLSNSISSISSTQHNSHSPIANNYQKHTTLPRQSGAFTISATLPNSSNGNHRTIPKSLAASGSLRLKREYSNHQSVVPLFNSNTPLLKPKETNIKESSSSPKSTNSLKITPSNSVPLTLSNDDVGSSYRYYKSRSTGASPSSSCQPCEIKPTETPKVFNFKPSLSSANVVNEEGSFDSVTCTCSSQILPPLHDDIDDYRSECENCKSASGSRYYLDNEDEMVSPETMTLQRRLDETASNVNPQYYRTSLTLPTSTRQRTNSGSRTIWLNNLPGSSTESSEGD